MLDSCLPGPQGPSCLVSSHPSVDRSLMRAFRPWLLGYSLFGLGSLSLGCCRPPPHRPRPLGGPEWPELSWEPRERLVRGRAGCPGCPAWVAGRPEEQGPGSEIGPRPSERWGRAAEAGLRPSEQAASDPRRGGSQPGGTSCSQVALQVHCPDPARPRPGVRHWWGAGSTGQLARSYSLPLGTELEGDSPGLRCDGLGGRGGAGQVERRVLFLSLFCVPAVGKSLPRAADKLVSKHWPLGGLGEGRNGAGCGQDAAPGGWTLPDSRSL